MITNMVWLYVLFSFHFLLYYCISFTGLFWNSVWTKSQWQKVQSTLNEASFPSCSQQHQVLKQQRHPEMNHHPLSRRLVSFIISAVTNFHSLRSASLTRLSPASWAVFPSLLLVIKSWSSSCCLGWLTPRPQGTKGNISVLLKPSPFSKMHSKACKQLQGPSVQLSSGKYKQGLLQTDEKEEMWSYKCDGLFVDEYVS